MEKRSSLNINLAKKKGTPTLDLFIHWAITGGRFLVIITETIAMAAFLYRFTLDGQIIDLHDRIKAKQAIISTYQSQEATYRALQDRLIQTRAVSQNTTFSTNLLSTINNLAEPNSILLRVVSVGKERIHIEVTTTNILNLKNFVGDLQKQKELKEISIDRIEDRTTSSELSAEISSEVIFPGDKVSGIAPFSTAVEEIRP